MLTQSLSRLWRTTQSLVPTFEAKFKCKVHCYYEVKGIVHPKIKIVPSFILSLTFHHHQFTLKLFQTCMHLFLQLNTKDILKNVGNQKVEGAPLIFYFFLVPYNGSQWGPLAVWLPIFLFCVQQFMRVSKWQNLTGWTIPLSNIKYGQSFREVPLTVN